MNCCPNCFSDHILANIINSQSSSISNCDFCATPSIPVLPPSNLADYFSPLFDLYEETSDKNSGKNIGELIRGDFMLFRDLAPDITEKLLKSISPKEEMGLRKFKMREDRGDSKANLWEDFREELKHSSRFFPKKQPSQEHLQAYFPLLIEEKKIGEQIYRARVQPNSEKYSIEEMKKPHPKNTKNGRANPVGISCLYASSQKNTAISEIRPHVGDYISVATITILKNLKLVDLTNPRRKISPFDIEEDMLPSLLNDLIYLCRLGEELEKPVIPSEADLEYLPSQYLCELIRELKYDGVIYTSSVGGGFNYAIFNDTNLKFEQVTCYKVESVEYSSQKV